LTPTSDSNIKIEVRMPYSASARDDRPGAVGHRSGQSGIAVDPRRHGDRGLIDVLVPAAVK
jgi:hypothetical protein